MREGPVEGRSEEPLRAELVQRYGKQMLFRPHAATAPLWLGPLALPGRARLLAPGRRRKDSA
ncbi:cytochrome c-type biogenesis protein CcmH [Roseateles sp.]|uniref:cytochrome c-type biogenesis protein CcmH n=1 Tax=Roseateles sp. TaxID=1971397 RepID=UPI002E0A7C4B|nr:cytochrome c-type biogenesis protein CcmH [Roseateles sp.]